MGVTGGSPLGFDVGARGAGGTLKGLDLGVRGMRVGGRWGWEETARAGGGGGGTRKGCTRLPGHPAVQRGRVAHDSPPSCSHTLQAEAQGAPPAGVWRQGVGRDPARRGESACAHHRITPPLHAAPHAPAATLRARCWISMLSCCPSRRMPLGLKSSWSRGEVPASAGRTQPLLALWGAACFDCVILLGRARVGHTLHFLQA